MSVELLVAPLKMLIATLGTGVLPATATAMFSETTRALGSAAELSGAGASRAATGVIGAGGTALVSAVRDVAKRDRAAGAAGEDIAAVVTTAAERVRRANTELNALVDSFVAAAATVPAVATPAGLAALIPLALDHLARGARVVARTQAELSADATAVGRHQAPAEVVDGTGRIPITLPDGSVAYAPNARAAKAVRAALSMRGTPYVWGGTDPRGFDCSGFTRWAYRQAGLELPRLAQDQDTAGFRVSQSQLQPGDLAVWSGHVAMYIGNGQLVEAGDPVQVSALRTSNGSDIFEGFYRPR